MEDLKALADEYEHQAKALFEKIEKLKPLLNVYTSEDLFQLRKRIKIYDDMACECRRTAYYLRGQNIDLTVDEDKEGDDYYA